MFSVSSDGMVRLCVEVTEHGAGLAAVELIEQLPVWAAAIWALMATAQAAAPAKANFRMVFNSGEVFSCVANLRPRCGCPRAACRYSTRFSRVVA
jgi:hypothetical protein